jgi:hypothetical protein
MSKIFDIDPCKNDGDQFAVEAADCYEAAEAAARRIHRRSDLTVRRTTGAADGSGMFAGYRHLRGSTTDVLVGSSFHVMER